MTTEFWIQMVVYAVSIGSFAGVVLTKLAYLEKKMDKHNGIVERVAALEKDVESIHYRIQEIREEFK
jgi:hypothetical protein